MPLSSHLKLLLGAVAVWAAFWVGEGVGYLAKYWYLTVFYFIPWALFVPMGFWLKTPSPE